MHPKCRHGLMHFRPNSPLFPHLFLKKRNHVLLYFVHYNCSESIEHTCTRIVARRQLIYLAIPICWVERNGNGFYYFNTHGVLLHSCKKYYPSAGLLQNGLQLNGNTITKCSLIRKILLCCIVRLQKIFAEFHSQTAASRPFFGVMHHPIR